MDAEDAEGRGFVAGTPTQVLAAFAAAAALGLLFSIWAFRGLRKAGVAGALESSGSRSERDP